MTQSQDNPEREERVARLLRQAAASERAPEGLRADLHAMEEEARARQRRAPAARSARQAWGGGGRPRAAAAASSLTDSESPFSKSRFGNSLWRGRPAAASKHAQARPRQLRAAVMSLILIAVVAVFAVIHSGGSQQPPAVAQVATLATLSPADPAPVTDGSNGSELTTQVQGLHFPNWSDHGWQVSGARQDELRGRPVTTVFYKHDGQQLAYSIVATPAIYATGKGAYAHQSFRQDGRNFVIWTVADHTCLLSGTGISAGQLWALAAPTTAA